LPHLEEGGNQSRAPWGGADGLQNQRRSLRFVFVSAADFFSANAQATITGPKQMATPTGIAHTPHQFMSKSIRGVNLRIHRPK
jgi:hypothetical protein